MNIIRVCWPVEGPGWVHPHNPNKRVGEVPMGIMSDFGVEHELSALATGGHSPEAMCTVVLLVYYGLASLVLYPKCL